jgi:hypothetical protein
MIHGIIDSGDWGLRLKRLDVGDDIPNGIFVRQRARHRAHQSAFAILGIRAANAAPEFSELRGKVPVVYSSDPRRTQVLISGAIVAMAGAASRV